jgi:hypothetical protein
LNRAEQGAMLLETEGGTMGRISVLAAALLAAAVFVAGAAADRAYRTEQLSLEGTAGAPGGGRVVNIHTNGPVIYAHEIYTLSHAAPGTYQVFLNLFLTSLDCTGPVTTIPTATIETNAAGNGQADATFTPEDAGDLRGLTFGISWTVVGPATYRSACTVVTLD